MRRLRCLVVLALLIALLWWAGPRLFYFAWINFFGSNPTRQTDISQLPRVLPSSDATLAVIHRGLPHQGYANGELFRGLFTTAHRSIGGYRFHTAPIAAADEQRNVYCDLSSVPAANGARAAGVQAEELQKFLDELQSAGSKAQ
jgi:hypothetical protein